MLLPLLVAACSNSGDSDDAASPTTTLVETTTTTLTGPTIDWGNVGSVDLGGGFALRDEEGDAPVVAIYRGDEHIGIIEINRFAKETSSLEEHVEKFHTALEADRKDGCGSDYDYEPVEASFGKGPDGPFAHYGFTGAKAGEAVTETTLQWAAFQGEQLVIINVAAYDEGGCVGTEGAELTTAELEEVAPLLGPVIERSPFPTGGSR